MEIAQIRQEIEQMYGFTPSHMTTIPEDQLASEWDLAKRIAVQENHIPLKYKELMGLAVAAATHCHYCGYVHTQLAKLFGATDQEIQEAVHVTKYNTGWSTYIHGMGIDPEQFKKEIDAAVGHVRQMMAGQ